MFKHFHHSVSRNDRCLSPHGRPRVSLRMLLVLAMIMLLAATSLTNAGETDFARHLPGKAHPILQSIIDDANASAQNDYVKPTQDLPDALRDMSYSTYRNIRFRPERAVWHNQRPFEVQLFHPGFLYQDPVTVTLIDAKNRQTLLPFDDTQFRFDGDAAERLQHDGNVGGYAGFRVHYPLNRQDYKDEFAVFLGASYFRLVGKHQSYGISARGLAIDTALPEGEEFPRFTHFWLIEPHNNASITVYARLESPSVSGAYKFVIQPGETTSAEVEAWLFARKDIRKPGFAPFTSMYLYGENSRHTPDDYRPEVHDSDGLMLHTAAGEWVWRPLTNPTRLQVTALLDDEPQGFGLLQRDRQFDHYLDSEALYHKRPGLWVTPKAGFGKGRLELVEIPTNAETHDNIVAYWVPEEPFREGQSRYLAYRLQTLDGQSSTSKMAWIVHTRHGQTGLPGDKHSAAVNARRFVVDFQLPEGLKPDPEALQLSLETTHGQISEANVIGLPDSQQVRVSFVLKPASQQPADMRMLLMQHGKRISEVWNYVYQQG